MRRKKKKRSSLEIVKLREELQVRLISLHPSICQTQVSTLSRFTGQSDRPQITPEDPFTGLTISSPPQCLPSPGPSVATTSKQAPTTKKRSGGTFEIDLPESTKKRSKSAIFSKPKAVPKPTAKGKARGKDVEEEFLSNEFIATSDLDEDDIAILPMNAISTTTTTTTTTSTTTQQEDGETDYDEIPPPLPKKKKNGKSSRSTSVSTAITSSAKPPESLNTTTTTTKTSKRKLSVAISEDSDGHEKLTREVNQVWEKADEEDSDFGVAKGKPSAAKSKSKRKKAEPKAKTGIKEAKKRVETKTKSAPRGKKVVAEPAVEGLFDGEGDKDDKEAPSAVPSIAKELTTFALPNPPLPKRVENPPSQPSQLSQPVVAPSKRSKSRRVIESDDDDDEDEVPIVQPQPQPNPQLEPEPGLVPIEPANDADDEDDEIPPVSSPPTTKKGKGKSKAKGQAPVVEKAKALAKASAASKKSSVPPTTAATATGGGRKSNSIISTSDEEDSDEAKENKKGGAVIVPEAGVVVGVGKARKSMNDVEVQIEKVMMAAEEEDDSLIRVEPVFEKGKGKGKEIAGVDSDSSSEDEDAEVSFFSSSPFL